MRALANGLLWGGCAVAVLGATQPWWTAGERTSITGGQATSGAALALVLAAVAGAFLSRWLPLLGRRVVLGLVALLAAGGVPVALGAVAPAVPGSTLGDALALVATPWRWVYVAGAVLTVVGAVLALLAGPPRSRPASTPDPTLDAWKALDAGDDPTMDAGERGVGGGEPTKRPQ